MSRTLWIVAAIPPCRPRNFFSTYAYLFVFCFIGTQCQDLSISFEDIDIMVTEDGYDGMAGHGIVSSELQLLVLDDQKDQVGDGTFSTDKNDELSVTEPISYDSISYDEAKIFNPESMNHNHEAAERNEPFAVNAMMATATSHTALVDMGDFARKDIIEPEDELILHGEQFELIDDDDDGLCAQVDAFTHSCVASDTASGVAFKESDLTDNLHPGTTKVETESQVENEPRELDDVQIEHIDEDAVQYDEFIGSSQPPVTSEPVSFAIGGELFGNSKKEVMLNRMSLQETSVLSESSAESAGAPATVELKEASTENDFKTTDDEITEPTEVERTTNLLAKEPLQQPYCAIWGTSRRKAPLNVSLLFTFFQYDILNNKTDHIFSDPQIEAAQLVNAAFEKVFEDKTSNLPLSIKPTNEFVDGLDDIDKFFEGVDAPEELDVGAGTSIREVLMRQGTRIIIKRTKMGLELIRRTVTAARTKAVERIRDDAGNRASVEAARQWLAVKLRKVIQATRRVVDDLMEGNFEGIMDAFGSDDDDDTTFDERLIMDELESLTGRKKMIAASNSPASSAPDGVEHKRSEVDAEIEDLIRLMGISPELSPSKSDDA
ncbi:hypothetical protein MPSEU_000477700 [Mayamaea pseudoterrestris]|nr:hypothetical protein MPSEU_000477700 [Mayamaea pseudoterrestris]